jgi:DNA invertase Pin-like site-specific DNA recombinase
VSNGRLRPSRPPPGDPARIGGQRKPVPAAARRWEETGRPQLDAALAYLREGDVLVITRLSRAMRSLKHMISLAEELSERGIGLKCLKQQIDTTTPSGRLVFHIFAALDEFQRELIVEGTIEGLAAAKARGKLGGRKPSYTEHQAQTARDLRAKGELTAEEIGEVIGVSRATVYRMLKDKETAA